MSDRLARFLACRHHGEVCWDGAMWCCSMVLVVVENTEKMLEEGDGKIDVNKVRCH